MSSPNRSPIDRGQSRRNLLTLKQLLEAAPWLSERYVRRLVAERRIPYYKPGGYLLFDLTEVDAYVESGRVDAVA